MSNGISSLSGTCIGTFSGIKPASEDLETEIGVFGVAIEGSLDSCVSEIERSGVASRCRYSVCNIAIRSCDDDLEVVLGGAGVHGVGYCDCAVPEYAFDGCCAGAGGVEGGGCDGCAFVENVEGVAVAGSCTFRGAGGNVVGGESGVTAIAVCVCAGMQVGEGVCVASGCRGVVCGG